MSSTVTITASIPAAQQGVISVLVTQTQAHTVPVLLTNGQSTSVVVDKAGQIQAIVSEVPANYVIGNG